MRWTTVLVLTILLLTGCKEKTFVPITQGEQMLIEKLPEPVVNDTLPAINETAHFEETIYRPATETMPAVGQPPKTNETVAYELPAEAPPSIAKYQAVFRNVKNYKFTYKNDKWFVSGKRAKMVPFRVLENTYFAPFIDTLYFDLENHTAIGVCEGRDTQIKRQCAQMGVLGKKYSVPYIQFKIMLPEDWLVEYQNLHMFVANTPKLTITRETVHLKHQTQTKVIDVYFDPTIGLPVAVVDNGIEYHYELLSKNSLGFQESIVP